MGALRQYTCTFAPRCEAQRKTPMDVISHPRREKHAHGRSRRCSWMHPHVPHWRTHMPPHLAAGAECGGIVRCKRDATSRRCRTNMGGRRKKWFGRGMRRRARGGGYWFYSLNPLFSSSIIGSNRTVVLSAAAAATSQLL